MFTHWYLCTFPSIYLHKLIYYDTKILLVFYYSFQFKLEKSPLYMHLHDQSINNDISSENKTWQVITWFWVVDWEMRELHIKGAPDILVVSWYPTNHMVDLKRHISSKLKKQFGTNKVPFVSLLWNIPILYKCEWIYSFWSIAFNQQNTSPKNIQTNKIRTWFKSIEKISPTM